MSDTREAAEAIVREAVRGTEPAERMRRALVHSDAMRELALSRLRAQFPDQSTIALVELLLGERLLPAPQPRGPA